MESQLVRSNGGHHKDHKLSPEEDGQQRQQQQQQQQQQQGQGHEKISVLKKVKAKARKLTDTIAAKHVRLQEQGQEHDRHDDLPDDHNLDEEENNEVDEVTNSEVHASPLNEPMTVAAVAGLRSGEPGHVKNQKEVGFVPFTTPDSESHAPGINRVPDRTIENFLGTSSTEEDPQSPTRWTDPPNYPTKVYDPTGLGSEEVDVSLLIQSIGKMTTEAEPKSGAERDRISSTKTESHDQFSPETVMKSIPSKGESEKRVSESSYTERFSSMTAAIVDKAISVKDVMVSKLGSADKDDYLNAETGIKDHANAPAQGEETSERPPVQGITVVVTEKLSPVCEKIVQTGSAVVSKVTGGGGVGVTEGKMNESSGVDTATGQDKRVSVKEYMAAKLKPGKEDKALLEVISETSRSKGVAGAVGGAVLYLLGKSGQPSPQHQASSGSGRSNKGEHQSEAVAEKSEIGFRHAKGA